MTDADADVCVCEGLSDEARADFSVMKDLAVHTRIGPADRVKRLQKFISDITKYVCCSFVSQLLLSLMFVVSLVASS